MLNTLRNTLTSIPALIVYLVLCPTLATVAVVLSLTDGGPLWLALPALTFFLFAYIIPFPVGSLRSPWFATGTCIALFGFVILVATLAISLINGTFQSPYLAIANSAAFGYSLFFSISVELRRKLTARKTQSV